MRMRVAGSIVGLCAVMSVQASLVVDLDPAASQTARVPDSTAANTATWNFNDTVGGARMATSANGGQNTDIYGGGIVTWDGAVATSTLSFGGYNSSTLRVQINQKDSGGNTLDSALVGVFLWNKADFLNGFDANPVVFQSGSSMSLNVSAVGGAGAFRFVVKEGGSYYVSETSKSAAVTGSFSIDPTAVNWALLNTSNYTFGTFDQNLNLDNVQAVGYHMDLNRSGAQILYRFDDFQVTTIPEPATLGLLGTASLAILLMRRVRGN